MPTSNANPYTGLLFSMGDILREIQYMRDLCRPFIDRTSFENIIPAWKKSLEGLRSAAPGQKLSWEIPRDRPIRTIESNGDYQLDGQGEYSVIGELACMWEIGNITNWRESGMSCSSGFLLDGIASSVVSIVNINGDPEKQTIARWTIDVGSNNSPGCHFHNHVKGGSGDRHFPTGLDIPRFPTYLITPMDALDFLLGEIFQNRWVEHVTKHSAGSGWPSLQKKRFKKSLEWHNNVLDDMGAGSPWTALKSSRPAKHALL